MPRDELDKLPHIRDDVGDRVVPLLPMKDADGEYHVWVDVEDGLQELQTAGDGVEEADYFAPETDHPNDIHFPFVEFVYQHCTWPGTIETVHNIREDVHHLAACFTKMQTYYQARENDDVTIRRLPDTEVEYILSTCRSMYDLLQEVARALWEEIELINEDRWKGSLPKRFGQVFLDDDGILPADELVETYGIPPELANYYVTEGPDFMLIKEHRDSIIHDGESRTASFIIDDGFGVSAERSPLREFDIWEDGMLKENNIAPLRPILAGIVDHTLGSMNRFVAALTKRIAFPPEIAPDYHVFMRGPHLSNLANLDWMRTAGVWEADGLEPE